MKQMNDAMIESVKKIAPPNSQNVNGWLKTSIINSSPKVDKKVEKKYCDKV